MTKQEMFDKVSGLRSEVAEMLRLKKNLEIEQHNLLAHDLDHAVCTFNQLISALMPKTKEEKREEIEYYDSLIAQECAKEFPDEQMIHSLYECIKELEKELA
jgi:hypothetical protein